MDLLARREHSRLELSRKLAARNFEQGVAEEVLDDLAADGLLSEERFTEAFVRGRLRKGKGPVRILMELKERGIDSHTARSALDGADVDWPSLAADALHKRFGAGAAGDIRERARRARFLGQRGFSAEQIRRAMELADTD